MEHLREIRNELLRLHKILMEIERENYEAQNGQVSNVQLLNLLFEHQNFTWLRDISGLVAEIDEAFAAKAGFNEERGRELIRRVETLFDDSDEFEQFKRRYRPNLDTENSVAGQHARIVDLLGK